MSTLQRIAILGSGKMGGVVVGHDMGAVHAYTFANRHPDHVRGLVYLDEPLPGFGYEQFAQLQPDPAMQGGFFFAHFHPAPDLPEALVAGRERIYLAYLMRRMSCDPSAFTEADLDEYVRGGVIPECGHFIAEERPAELARELRAFFEAVA